MSARPELPKPAPSVGTAPSSLRARAARLSIPLVSSAGLLILWWLASLGLPDTVLPGPFATLGTLWENAVSGVLLPHFLATMRRIVLGFALAMGISVVAGLVMGLTKIGNLLGLWVMVALTIPSLVYIIVSFMWFGLTELATVVAVALTGFPAMAITIAEGVRNLDNRLGEMARTFNARRGRRLRKVVLPQTYPYILASSRFGLGIIWKVTVIAELLGRSNGIGFQLHRWFQLFNMNQVLAWTTFFVVIMLVIELGVLKPLENRLFRWRETARL